MVEFNLILSLLLYLLAHMLRLARLSALALHEGSASSARLWLVHCLTALPGAITPFKLGELLRVLGFMAVSRRWVGGLAVWFIERYFDALVIVSMAFVATLLVGPSPRAITLMAIMMIFVILVTMLAWLLLEILPVLRRDLTLRSRSGLGLKMLDIVIELEDLVAEVKHLLRGRLASSLILSLCIWLLEGLAIVVFLGPRDFGGLINDLLNMLLSIHPTSSEYTSIGLWILFGIGCAMLVGSHELRRKEKR